MKSRKAKKQRFFDLGNKALNKLSAEYLAGYVCPICGTEFLSDAIDSGDLTLEHAPPESLGGRAITLTCVKCNCPAGSSIDAAMRNRHLLQHFFIDSEGFQRARLEMMTYADTASPVGEEKLMERVSDRENLLTALGKVKHNRGSPG
ncbi:MAG: HNH endonuclease, partial [Thermodesulfobacteriota bacterium]|nr:HNH endonuclease [Thermodesulfobacteriota bacterium]